MLLAGLIPAGAQESLLLTLRSIPDRVKKQNPDLAAARLQVNEAIARSKAAGRLSNPELEFEYEGTRGSSEASGSIGIVQKFPITSRLKLEKAVSLAEIAEAKIEIQDFERQLIGNAQQLLIEIQSIDKQRSLLNKQIANANELADFIKQAAEKGERSILDAGQARLEAAQLSNEIRQLKAEQAKLTGDIKTLLGLPVSARVKVADKLPAIETPQLAITPQNRADYQLAKQKELTSSQLIALERANRYEDIEAGIHGGLEKSQDHPDPYETETKIGLSITIPLPLWNKNEGAIEEAQARQIRSQKETVALEANIKQEATTAKEEMLEWAKLAREVQAELLPLAETQVEQLNEAYINGQTDLQSVLRSREQLLNLSSSLINATKEFHLARVRFLCALGKN